MRKRLVPAALILTVFLGGCGPLTSLSPLYNSAVMTTNDALVGRWETVDEKDSEKKEKKDSSDCCLVFEKDGGIYRMTIPAGSDKEILRSTIHLVKLGDATFLDIEPAKVDYAQPTQLPFPQLSAHHFGRIWIEKDSLKIALLSDDWLDNYIKTKQSPLAFVHSDDGLVLTATTEELQAFAKEHADDKDAFSDLYEMKRVR